MRFWKVRTMPRRQILCGGKAADRRAVEDDAAGVGAQEPGQQAEDGRLARAVGTDEPQNFAGLDGEIQAD